MNSITDLILQLDIEKNYIVLLLYLPIAVTIIGVARYIIGIKSVGIYAPIVITFLFYQFGYNFDTQLSEPLKGLQYGLTFLIIVLLSTFLIYQAIKPFTLHYYSKLAIVITGVIISIIGFLIFADYVNRDGILRINVFSLILIATLTERFLNMLAFNKSFKTMMFLLFETTIISLICYLIIAIPYLQNLLLKYPLIILLNFPINYLIGRFSGLRLREYYRFQEILDNEEE